jgi:hypothetical protein
MCITFCLQNLLGDAIVVSVFTFPLSSYLQDQDSSHLCCMAKSLDRCYSIYALAWGGRYVRFVVVIPVTIEYFEISALTIMVITDVHPMLLGKNPRIYSQLSNYLIIQYSLTLASNLISTGGFFHCHQFFWLMLIIHQLC